MEFSNKSSVESFEELLNAQTHVWNHTFNFINSMSLKCAIELGIQDIIHKHGKPMTLSELIQALPISKSRSNGLFRLMRILIHSKFFVKVKISENDEDEGYWLTPASCLLLRDQATTMAPFVLAMLDPIFLDPWHRLGEWFQSDSLNAYTIAHGMSLFEHASQEPRLNKSINEATAGDAHMMISVMIKECKPVFQGLQSMVDVGGGTGNVARAIVDAFPGLKCVVLDLPHVVDGLEGTETLSYVSGNMFESIPRADAVFLKWTLHDWSDEECVKILEKCKDAITQKDNGARKVIIVDIVLEYNPKDCKSTETQLFFDLELMTLLTGKERTEKEWAKLFFASGFKSYKITHALGLRSVIEVFP